jgi:hypothetical protein
LEAPLMADWVSKPLPGTTATRQPYTSSYVLPGLAAAPLKTSSSQYTQAFTPTPPPGSAPLQTQAGASPSTPGSYLPGVQDFGQGPVSQAGGSAQQQQQAPAQQPGGGTKPTTWTTPAASSSTYTMAPRKPDLPFATPLKFPSQPETPGSLRAPGAYEDWYASHKGQFDQPTNIQGYYDRNKGDFENYSFDPSNTQGAYDQLRSGLSGDSYGMSTGRGIAGRLQNPLDGEAYFGQAGGLLNQPNLTADYAQKNAGFFQGPTDSKNLYGNLQGEMMKEGVGEEMARVDLPGLNTVGSEFDYFRDPLRAKSYSEQLYESGNEGLNKFYDRENEKRQEALERRMAATGVFGSGETVKGMAEIEAELGAQQARDMAGLAGQADEAFRSRAGLSKDFAGASSREDLDRIGLGLEADKGTRDRYGQLIDLAGQSDETSLDRILGGKDVMRAGDESRFDQAEGLRSLGDTQSEAVRRRLTDAAGIGFDVDAEQRARLNDVFGAGKDLDDLRLDADRTRLDYLSRGGDLAGDADSQRLDWLTAGGDAADAAQRAFEQRERYGVNDALRYADSVSKTFTSATDASNKEQTEMQGQAINLLMQKHGLSYQQAMQQAEEWSKIGSLPLQLAQLQGGGGL